MAKKKKKDGQAGWSYSAGEWGRNRVRAFKKDGKYYLEWYEQVIDDDGLQTSRSRQRALILDPETRQPVTSLEEAKARADILAGRFASGGSPERIRRHPLVKDLIDQYLEEVTPTKGKSKQQHDRRVAKIFKELFGEVEARNLDRLCWDRFIHERRNGEIPGFGSVGNRVLEYDLKFMISVLGWACGVKLNGVPLLQQNPWGPEVRRAHRMMMPRERSPNRPSMTDEIRSKLIAHSPSWQFRLALILGRYTISRNSSVRQLRWSDVDLEAATIRWRKESDKSGNAALVPLLPEAIEALRAAPRGIGDAFVFPSARDSSRPTPRGTFQVWMRRAKKSAGIRIKGLGFHGEKRAGVRDSWFRSLDPKMKETLSRTNHQTLIDIYDQVELDEMREAVKRRQDQRRFGRG